MKYSELSWLLPAPADFRELFSQVDPEDPQQYCNLANFSLSSEQLRLLGRRFSKARQIGNHGSRITPYRLGILASGTLDLITDGLVGSALRHEISLEITCGDYGQILQQSLDPNSAVNRTRLDGVLIAQDFSSLALSPCIGNPEAAEMALADLIGQLDASIRALQSHQDVSILVQTVPLPPYGLMGSSELVTPGTMHQIINGYNRHIHACALARKICVVDIAGLSEIVGRDQWHDPVLWHHAKQPFSMSFVPLYCEIVARVMRNLRNMSKRCLILDLDNTVWGGAVGDVGVHGIELGNGSGVGEAFLELQKTALLLRSVGVVLALCSKNDDALAMEVFDHNSEMLLKREHFAAREINWREKSTNIRKIADTLRLGLNTLVYMDDNPAERAAVRSELPMVSVPEIGDDPAFYADMLLSAGYFERVHLSNEDLARADLYKAENERTRTKSQFANVETYLVSLATQMAVEAIGDANRARTVQLINKTNQFNLTSKRYSEEQIRTIEASRDHVAFTFRLSDKFSDHGLIAVVLCRIKDRTRWHIESWLMSCRVLNRGVENAMINHIVGRANENGIEFLSGEYIPSERNGMVSNMYGVLGFEEQSTGTDGVVTFQLRVGEFKKFVHQIKLI